MAAIAAGAQVGAGEPAKAQLGAVGAAADRQLARLDAGGKVRLFGKLDQLRILAHDLGHVAVLLFDLNAHTLLAELPVHKGGRGFHQVELGLELVGAVVAHDVARRGVVDRRRDADVVDKSLVALGVLRARVGGQHVVELHEQVRRVDHAALGVAGVDRVALKAHGHVSGVKALPLELADGAAVDRVGVFATERRDIEQRGTVADLLIGAKADAECRVRDLRVFVQTADERHDLGHAGLVVGAEKRGAVGAHQVLAAHVDKLGELFLGHGNGLALNGPAHQVAAFVVHDMRLYARSGRDLGGVEMGDEPECRLVLGARARLNMGGHVAVLVHVHVVRPELAQLIGQQVREVELHRARGHLVAVGVL